MKPLNPKIVLDPLWLCQANHVDLEYYTYIMMGAQKTYIDNLEEGFSNFYEIIFHYLNLNTVIADKKLYDSQLNAVRSHKNILLIVSQLAQLDDAVGKSVVKMASGVLIEVIKQYLAKQIIELEKLHFHFNNSFIHKQGKIYIVCNSIDPGKYEVFKLNMHSKRKLGYSITHKATVLCNDLKQNEFRNILIKENPLLSDFCPDKNVIVVSGTNSIGLSDAICLAKDTILLNRIANPEHGFDANMLLDYSRLLEKRKTIPYKFKV